MLYEEDQEDTSHMLKGFDRMDSDDIPAGKSGKEDEMNMEKLKMMHQCQGQKRHLKNAQSVCIQECIECLQEGPLIMNANK